MPLNKVNPKSNMYSFLNDYPKKGRNRGYTWNTVKGKCPHDTEYGYCYMKKWGEQPELHFDEKELKTNLGEGNFIFTGSSCDLFADKIPLQWIQDTLEYCCKFDNRYLFQSKNPERIIKNQHRLPCDVIIGTTIESNKTFKEMCNAPSPYDRAKAMKMLHFLGYKTMLTIEPICDFDLDSIVELIQTCKPNWINIGANTNSKVRLQEPEPEKVMALIERLSNIAKVKIKPNLKRLMR